MLLYLYTLKLLLLSSYPYKEIHYYENLFPLLQTMRSAIYMPTNLFTAMFKVFFANKRLFYMISIVHSWHDHYHDTLS